jgi:hypothetical protein
MKIKRTTMAAAKKVKGKKTGPGTRKRLTDEQKQAIVDAPTDMTLQAIADKVGTTINTVSKYRNAAPAKEPKAIPVVQANRAGASGKMVTIPIQAKFDGGQLNFSFSRKELLQILADTE